MAKLPFANVNMAPPAVEVTRRDDGIVILDCPTPLRPYEAHLGEMLRRQAQAIPQRPFLAERTEGGAGPWRTLTFGEAGRAADAIGQALLERGLGPARPVMILSRNSINHALLSLGALVAGVPVVPVSPAYSLVSSDYSKVKFIRDLTKPGLVYVEERGPFERTLAALALDGEETVVGSGDPAGATPLAELSAGAPGARLSEAFAAIGPDTVAKILFTSGSTGPPKGVINTHRMMCANQQMLVQVLPFLTERPPVLVDWLPWHHTFGGNHNFNLILRNGGTLYIDAGKPLPHLVGQSIANLREVPPVIYYNVPAGFNLLLPYLEREEALREVFFRDLKMIGYAGAALPQDLWDRLEAVSSQARGERVVMTSGWGSTETAPMATLSHWPTERAGVIGLPVPGVSIKMAPNGDKMELRVKGPNIMPGYLERPEQTAAAFDEEGYYRIGDAGRFADPEEPLAGLFFDGRIAEDFKLASGTWVHAGGVRIAAIHAAAPALMDAVVAGQDREEIGLLAWPNLNACREIAGAPEDEPPEGLLARPEVTAHIARGLARHNGQVRGSSARIARFLLMTEPPDLDANEITDKGSINQRAALERRAPLVERLYADPPGEGVVIV